ncbi:MAG: hypothetical protein ACOYWZ_03595 [Bacillota bacterium]
MSDNLLKILLKTKLSLIDSSLSLLPDGARHHAESLKKEFLKALNEVTGDYLKTHPQKKEEKSVRAISIE